MQTRSLAEWLDYQQRLHAQAIALGLDRVHAVWHALGAPRPAPIVITVGGTNGKGSTVAFLESMLRAMGVRVGSYTSPHLQRYNERVRIDGRDASDALLIDAFERVEQARGEIALTWFEFGTLAALSAFARHGLDVALLEVGLGGRLDAVNIIDADAAIIATVDLDHQEWLGNDIESIGREKAGIFRAGRPAIVGMADPPQGLLAEAVRIGAHLLVAGRDYAIEPRGRGWRWRCADASVALPASPMAADCQAANAAAAIMALHALRDRLPWDDAAIARGMRDARIAGRLQHWRIEGGTELVIDVAHNPQAAQVLARWIAATTRGERQIAVFGALSDKDIAGIVAPLAPLFAQWHLCSLDTDTPRGLSAAALRDRSGLARARVHATVHAALDAAAEHASGADRLIAFGSFHVAGPAIEWANARASTRGEPL